MYEEVLEFLHCKNIDELVDILEVVDTIIYYKKWKWNEILKVKLEKRIRRGGLKEGYVIELL